MSTLNPARDDPAFVDSYVHLETPENIWLSFRPAGPAPRLWAYLVDLAIRLGAFVVLAILVSFLTPLNVVAGLPVALLLLGYFAIDYLYGFLFEWLWRGRTPGKGVMRLKVIKVEGHPVGFYDAFVRNLFRIADALPVGYGLGLVVCLSNSRMQRIGDLVAGTFVIHEEREVVRGYPPWVHDVPVLPAGSRRARFVPGDRVLDEIEVFLTRAQRLSRERADEIASILAIPLAARMGYQEETPGEVRASPGWFLLRVLRTFVYPPTPPTGHPASPGAGLAPPPGAAHATTPGAGHPPTPGVGQGLRPVPTIPPEGLGHTNTTGWRELR